ncbi:MAG: tryptophan synthase subunit alpha [Myxococcales bacterium]|nr:MAG: tryptophan synthase subunit alpha [Myxococcales bacterium]
MNAIAKAFDKAKHENRAALVIYLCAGDPDLESTAELIKVIAEAGADVIELGVPFSDPTADGEVIQRASERALARGTTLGKIFSLVTGLRSEGLRTPILLFGYYNPLLAFGEKEAVAAAKKSGVDGFLVVDLPPDEENLLYKEAIANDLAVVPLVAPTSTEERKQKAAELCNSFLYYVSVTGVTGAKTANLAEAAKNAAALAKQYGKPVAVGFGIKTAADVKEVVKHADAVVVGSAIVSVIETHTDKVERCSKVSALIKELRNGLA